MKKKISTEEILSLSTPKLLLKLGWPIMLASLLDTVYQLVDTFWLGRLSGGEGGNSVAALQISFPIIWFLVAFIMGFSMAGVAFVSQFNGAGRIDEADKAGAQVLSLALISGVVSSALLFIAGGKVLSFVTSDAAILKASSEYITVLAVGLPFMFINGVFRSLLTSTGNSFTPMVITIISNIINVILDPFFITGIGPIPAMGVKGAAIATVISGVFSALVAVYYLFEGKKGISINLKNMVPDLLWIKKVVKVGFPAAVGHSAEALGFVILSFIIGQLDNSRTALAAYGIGSRLISLASIAMMGFAQSLTTIIGQKLGADMIKSAAKSVKEGMLTMFVVLLAETALMVFFRRELVSVFIPDEPDIIEEGCRFLLYFGSAIPLFGILRSVNATFSAAGVNMPVLILGIFRLWIFRLPLVYLLGIFLGYGSGGAWIGMTLGNFFTVIIALAFLKSGKWKRRVI